MKKKIILSISLIFMLLCIFAISISAAEMANYCDVKLTLVSGEAVTAYCKIDTESNTNNIQRDNLYKTTDTSGGTYSWADVVIFDARNTTIVGTITPDTFRGVNCNSQATSCTTVYFPSCITTILNTSFTSDWTALDTVYLNKELTTIQHDAFYCSPVKKVVIEDDSQLKTIDYNAFQGCKNLTTINLQEGLESLGRNCFYQAGLEGTFKVPNSVTYLAPGSLLSTKIETLILGDGDLTIGYNFAGDYNSKNNQYLKNVYISAQTVIESTNTFFKCANPVNFYVVGDSAALFDSQQSGNYIDFIMASEVTESTGAGYGIIYTGYNRCDAFYNGAHTYVNSGNEIYCEAECSLCGKILGAETEHTIEISEVFEGERYLSSCVVTKYCTSCQYEISKTNVGAIMVWLGYSVSDPDSEGKVAMSQRFRINGEQLSTYQTATGKTIEYGLVAANAENEAPLTVKDGKVSATNGALLAAFSGKYYEFFEVKLVGIESTKYETPVVFSAYACDGKSIYYINDNKTTSSPVPTKYSQFTEK